MNKHIDQAYYQELIELTPEQKKAWTQLVRAVNRCKKEKIYFYQNLDSLGGLNGRNVAEVVDGLNTRGDAPNCLQYLDYPTVKTSCSFADDDHFVILHGE